MSPESSNPLDDALTRPGAHPLETTADTVPSCDVVEDTPDAGGQAEREIAESVPSVIGAVALAGVDQAPQSLKNAKSDRTTGPGRAVIGGGTSTSVRKSEGRIVTEPNVADVPTYRPARSAASTPRVRVVNPRYPERIMYRVATGSIAQDSYQKILEERFGRKEDS
jgi:hypothetical protein